MSTGISQGGPIMHGRALTIYHEGEGESIFVAHTELATCLGCWGLIQLPKSTFLVNGWVWFLHSVNSLGAGPKSETPSTMISTGDMFNKCLSTE